MKNLTTILSALCLFAMISCDPAVTDLGDGGGSVNPEAPSITAPESGTSYTLLEENGDDDLFVMEWTRPDYGIATTTNFALAVDMDQSGEFSDTLVTTTDNAWSIEVRDMNNMLRSADYPADQQVTLDFKVGASNGDYQDGETLFSEPISLGFTPYSACDFCPEIYVAGSFQAAGGYGANWTPANGPPLGAVNEGEDIYQGYVYFAAPGGFKVTGERSWDDNWGTTDGGTTNEGTTSGTLGYDVEGENIVVDEAGYYQINADLVALTYSFTRTEWGIIGTATANDWDSDQDMTLNPTTKVWSITTDLTAGALKFRANDAWTINYGPANSDALQGDLIQTDGAINIPSDGNYTVDIDLNDTNYTYTVTAN